RTVQRNHDEERREEEDRGAAGDQRDFEDLLRSRSLRTGVLVDQERRNQRGEEETFRTDKGPDRQLPVIDRKRSVMRRVGVVVRERRTHSRRVLSDGSRWHQAA